MLIFVEVSSIVDLLKTEHCLTLKIDIKITKSGEKVVVQTYFLQLLKGPVAGFQWLSADLLRQQGTV